MTPEREDKMEGAEIYTESVWYHRNPEEIQKRAVEDAKFLVDMNLDGYEYYGARGLQACKKFLARVAGLEGK